MTRATGPGERTGGVRGRRIASLVAKALVSAALLVIVVRSAGWAEILRRIAGADALLVLLYVALGLVAIVVSSLRWLVLARALGMNATLTQLTRLYLVGGFVNLFLPATVGGDVVRGCELGRPSGQIPVALASVFMERFSGLTVMLAMALLATLGDARLMSEWKVTVPLGALTVAYVVGACLILHPAPLRLMNSLPRIPGLAKIVAKAQRLQSAIHLYRHHRGSVALSVVLSLVFYLVSAANVYVGCVAFSAEPRIADLLLVVPVMLMLFMLPISIGGIGLQEWAYLFTLGLIGVPVAIGASLGFLFRARSLLFGMAGGCLYPFGSGARDLSAARSVPAQP